MNYSKEDMLDLIQHLETYIVPSQDLSMWNEKELKYEVLLAFLQTQNAEGLYDFGGLSDPPSSVASARAVENLKSVFPDVVYALQMPDSEVPLWVGEDNCLEYPVACWRLKRK
jgi:hypothetical protein